MCLPQPCCTEGSSCHAVLSSPGVPDTVTVTSLRMFLVPVNPPPPGASCPHFSDGELRPSGADHSTEVAQLSGRARMGPRQPEGTDCHRGPALLPCLPPYGCLARCWPSPMSTACASTEHLACMWHQGLSRGLQQCVTFRERGGLAPRQPCVLLPRAWLELPNAP